MKNLFIFLAVLMSAVLFAQETAPADQEVAPAVQEAALPAPEAESEKDWGVALSLQYADHYFDKGKYSNTDAVLQADAEFTWKQLFVGATGYYDFTDQNDHDDTFEEYDYIAGWRPVIGGDWNCFIQGIDCQIAYAHYVYPRKREDDSNEINLAVNAQCLLAPGVDFYWDFENDIVYGNFNVSHGIELMERLALNLESALWWGNRQFQERDYEVSRNSFVSVELGASLDYAITDSLTLSPFFQCGWALGQQMRDSWKAEDHQEDFNTNYGVALAWEF